MGSTRVSLAFARLLASLVLSGSLYHVALAASDPADELKAAIILSFLRYTEWPSSVATDNALTVGVLGPPSLIEGLRRVLDGKAVDNRLVKVLEIQAEWDTRCCRAVYLATGKPDEIKQALGPAAGGHVLTIGESKRFLELGGAVNLRVVDGRMSFEVSLEALERSGVSISSTLLRFGQTRDTRKGKPPA